MLTDFTVNCFLKQSERVSPGDEPRKFYDPLTHWVES